jgi:hypothetical protein
VAVEDSGVGEGVGGIGVEEGLGASGVGDGVGDGVTVARSGEIHLGCSDGVGVGSITGEWLEQAAARKARRSGSRLGKPRAIGMDEKKQAPCLGERV